MPEYFYMQPLWACEDGTLACILGEGGSVTRHPFEVYKRYVLAREKRKRGISPHPCPRDRTGDMFAVWTFPERPTSAEAQAHAKVTPPHRVYVVTSNHRWGFAPFVLPEDMTIDF